MIEGIKRENFAVWRLYEMLGRGYRIGRRHVMIDAARAAAAATVGAGIGDDGAGDAANVTAAASDNLDALSIRYETRQSKST